MFDPGILHLVEGANIWYNAITLTIGFHRRFGSLQIYFEDTLGADHTYTIKSTLPFLVFRPRLPITRALFMTPDRPPNAMPSCYPSSLLSYIAYERCGEYTGKVP
jgi:hypothetical protein